MALKSIIYKADLHVSDLNRNNFGEFPLTIARHPSETDERMMVRLLAFALHASPVLSFGNGLSTDDEPDLWEKDLTGAIRLWIDVGQPDEKRLLKACGRSEQVVVYSYSHASDIWWNQIAHKVDKAKNLTVMQIPSAHSLKLGKLANRKMALQCTRQDEQVWFSSGEDTEHFELIALR